jgi:2-phospho-L-lactate transferase/gluconeogenesis factor (CofD/UPF0052 family)
MQLQGLPVSPEGVARFYADFLDVLIADERDASALRRVSISDVRFHCTQTLMKSLDDKVQLARAAVESTRQAQVVG